MLTFVDMSRLKYLSKSVTSGNKLSRKKTTAVEIPKTTGTAIEEALSEDDSDESPTKV